MLFMTLQVFVKVELTGTGNHFVLQEILDGLKLTLVEFQAMCSVAGCNYLDNVRGIGIQREYALVCGKNLFDDLLRKGAQ